MLIYAPQTQARLKTYHMVHYEKKHHIKKNLLIKALQVKMFSLHQYTNVQITTLNPDVFYAIQHDYYTKVTVSRLLLLQRSQAAALWSRILTLAPPVLF